MCIWIRRHLPGPLPARLLGALLLFALAVLLLTAVVFPAVGSLLPWEATPVRSGPGHP